MSDVNYIGRLLRAAGRGLELTALLAAPFGAVIAVLTYGEQLSSNKDMEALRQSNVDIARMNVELVRQLRIIAPEAEPIRRGIDGILRIAKENQQRAEELNIQPPRVRQEGDRRPRRDESASQAAPVSEGASFWKRFGPSSPASKKADDILSAVGTSR